MSGSDPDRDIAKDLLSSLLTQRQGEYIIRIGQQPPHAKLFSDELADDCEGWSGASRTHDEIDKLRTAIIETVEEIGGKVRSPFGWHIHQLTRDRLRCCTKIEVHALG